MKADTHSLTAAPHTHTVELFSKSLQIPDVWVSLRVGGGEEIDLSLAVVSSSPLFFRTSRFVDCHGGFSATEPLQVYYTKVRARFELLVNPVL